MRAFELAREIICAPARRTNNSVILCKIICAPTKFWPPPVQGTIKQRSLVRQEEFQSEMPVVRGIIVPLMLFSYGKDGTHGKAATPMFTV